MVPTASDASSNASSLSHIIYTSAAAPGFDPAELMPILQAARSNNASRAVTGMLLYISGSFFQVLEGDEATLAELFATISADLRHTRVTKIIHEPITRRVFDGWTMGYAEITADEMAGIDGLSDFFQEGNSLANLEPGRAKKMLAAFGQGRWRARVKATQT